MAGAGGLGAMGGAQGLVAPTGTEFGGGMTTMPTSAPGATGSSLGGNAASGLSQGTLSELSKMFPNASVGNILTALGQYAQSSSLGGDLKDIAQRAIDAANPFKQPERQPFIGTNSPMGMESLLKDPSGFLANDPYINSMKQGIGEQAQANFAKSGNLPREAINSSAAVGNVMSDAYKDRLGLTSVLGGYTIV